MIPKPKMRPKPRSAQNGFARPSKTPKATPVSEAWPMASEKNAMRLLTTKVPIRANRGETIRTASKAVRMKANCVHSKGNRPISSCQKLMFVRRGGCKVKAECSAHFRVRNDLLGRTRTDNPAIEENDPVG